MKIFEVSTLKIANLTLRVEKKKFYYKNQIFFIEAVLINSKASKIKQN